MGWEVCSLSLTDIPFLGPPAAPDLPASLLPFLLRHHRRHDPPLLPSATSHFLLPPSLPPIYRPGRRGSLLQGRWRGGPPGSILLLSYALTHCKKAPGKEGAGGGNKKRKLRLLLVPLPLGTESSTLSRRSEMNQSCFFCRPLLAPVLVLLVLVPKL